MPRPGIEERNVQTMAERLPEGSGQVPGFELMSFAHEGRIHDVYRAGSGPAVVVVHEIPGIHPGVIGLAERPIDAGFTAYLPSLVGRAGELPSTGAIVRSILRVCVSREFAMLADRTSAVVTWLRALAAQAHGECGGPGVGAIGMCLTDGFALAMAVEPSVLAPVLSQPALPAPVTARKRAAFGLDDMDLARVKERAQRDLRVLGLRFSRDRGCPAERFETLRRELGESFESIEVDSSPGNAHEILSVHMPCRPSTWSTN